MTYGLEGRRSIQLSYGRKGPAYDISKKNAPFAGRFLRFQQVGAPGFEPGTSCSQSRRASRATLRPVKSTKS
jgi:hypothetical protein